HIGRGQALVRRRHDRGLDETGRAAHDRGRHADGDVRARRRAQDRLLCNAEAVRAGVEAARAGEGGKLVMIRETGVGPMGLIGFLALFVVPVSHAQTPADVKARAHAYYAWRDSIYPVATSDHSAPRSDHRLL